MEKSVLDKIKDLLSEKGIQYELLEHDPVYTSEEAARVRDTSLSMGAKALILFADKIPILTVVPGDKRLDFKKFKSSFNVKDLHMATPEEVTDLTTLKIGSIPPIGKALGIKSYYDESILNNNIVAFNAGSHTVSIRMKASDLVNIEDPVISSIT